MKSIFKNREKWIDATVDDKKLKSRRSYICEKERKNCVLKYILLFITSNAKISYIIYFGIRLIIVFRDVWQRLCYL